jgi:hypothetical protein
VPTAAGSGKDGKPEKADSRRSSAAAEWHETNFYPKKAKKDRKKTERAEPGFWTSIKSQKRNF